MRPRSGDLTPFGSGGGGVEVDETYFGQRKGVAPWRGGHAHKLGVVALVNHTTGTMRTFTFDKSRADQVHPIVRPNISREARLMTDEAIACRRGGSCHAPQTRGQILEYIYAPPETIAFREQAVKDGEEEVAKEKSSGPKDSGPIDS